MREDDSVDADAARLSPADRENATSTGRWRCTAKGGPTGTSTPESARALSAVLINPEFLFRVEADPEERRRRRRRTASAISSSPRGSRSSCGAAFPDDELLDVGDSRPAEPARGAREADAQNARRSAIVQPGDQLRRTVAAAAQSRRGRAEHALFPDFDDNVRAGVPAGNGALYRQRRARGSQRAGFDQGGLHLPQRAPREALRHSQRLRQPLPPRDARHPRAGAAACCVRAACSSVTSYATRTSPIIRGVYVLDNIFGAPPPPPLPNVPALDESTVSASLPMRERLAAHRKNAVCASCHRTIDPVGFALENFNASGNGAAMKAKANPSTRRARCRAPANFAA